VGQLSSEGGREERGEGGRKELLSDMIWMICPTDLTTQTPTGYSVPADAIPHLPHFATGVHQLLDRGSVRHRAPRRCLGSKLLCHLDSKSRRHGPPPSAEKKRSGAERLMMPRARPVVP
jgi:hypothetical protein